ncbi:HNH endonuclease [Bacillus pseudomycoides]|uniref:NUMOD4 motif-containing HNH endonuclease n=1 Tax=Bacillus pseudomycoides TaxID=64104 RepID=UPI000BF11134|nr:NUMOD4 domain-containing protein [Bacillus pseudomycoides]PEI42608.1 HNH endonuclease [Bacillus pseudomycoides]
MFEELWKPISGYEGIYEVSSLGRVRSLDRVIVDYRGIEKSVGGKILKPGVTNKGYYIVSLNSVDKRHTLTVHRLVANAFIPNLDNKPQVNHINGIKTDNRICNLEWLTNEENMKHAINNGLANKGGRKKGSQNKRITISSKKSNNVVPMSIEERRELDKIRKRESRQSIPREQYLKEQEEIRQKKVDELKNIILDNPSLNKKQLAEKMGVSRKTVYRLYKFL